MTSKASVAIGSPLQVASLSPTQAKQGLSVPMNPRAKLIQWSVSDRLEVLSMIGDFTDLGIGVSQKLSEQRAWELKQLQVFEMLGEKQVQGLFDQFQAAMLLGQVPDSCQLRLYTDDKVRWVEQETVMQKTPDGSWQFFSYWSDVTRLKLAENNCLVFRQVIDAIPSWIFIKNSSHKYELVNQAYAGIYGVSPQECLGKDSAELGVPQEIAEKFWADDRDVFNSGKPKEVFAEPIVINGELRHLNTHKTPVKDLVNGKELLIGYCHDITYLKQIEERIGVELQFNKTLNEVNRILRSENRSHQLLVEIEQLLTRETGCLTVDIQLDLSEKLQVEQMENTRLYTTPVVFNGPVIAQLNTWHDQTHPLTEAGKKLLTAVASKLGSFLNQQKLHARINHQANFDSLTTLPNRHNILGQIARAVDTADQTDSSCGVIIIDLDGFKSINDTFGHYVGDKMLVAAARRLQNVAAKNEIVARLGGDEFAILLTDVASREFGMQRAEKYLASLTDSFNVDGRTLNVGGSLGVSFYPDDCSSSATIMQHADQAMYVAKSRGRNNCQAFTAEIADQAQRRASLENDLGVAIRSKRELFLNFQPQFELKSKRVVGVEALVRWNHPERGLVSPSELIMIAEETGLIIPLGAWIMRNAFEVVAQWNQKLEHKVKLSLNVTPPELEQCGLTDLIFQTLEETGLDPTLLDLEITETFLMKRFDHASKCLGALRDRGIKVSIDDFGTGYSCMSYLHCLPVDSLKIDASFVERLGFSGSATEVRQSSITETIVKLAKSVGLETVAEGIENEKQCQHLLDLGVEYGQGFWFSKPLDASEALTFVQQNQ